MDTTDPDITFNTNGVCNWCERYENETSKYWLKGDAGKAKMQAWVNEIKEYGKGKEYDCIIGLSGGIDSSYLAYLGTQLGLRMLAVHVDAGWNSELAVQNIQNICTKLKIDLVTEVVDWSVMRKVQLAFLRTGLVNQDIPQDQAFFAALYNYAQKNNIKYVLNGVNIATENTLPTAWRGENAMDDILVKSVYKYYFKQPLKNFPLIGYWKFNLINYIYKKFIVVDLLNCFEYSKEEALKTLAEVVDYKDYGGKHNESRFTKFHQNYFLVKKHGVEKRRAHIASLVISGLLSREAAVEILATPLYKNQQEENEDIDYISKKLGISVEEFHDIMKSPSKNLSDFTSGQRLHKKIRPYLNAILKVGGKVKRMFK
jgi:N-acetyl sugar amidotransferase